MLCRCGTLVSSTCTYAHTQLPAWVTPTAIKIDGLTPTTFRLTFDKELVNHMKDMTKIATLRVVKENGERKWWNSLEKAFSSSTRLVRAQTDRAHKTIFGGCRINSLSAAAPISTFLNPLSKKEFGCEGWSNQKYIDRWCNGMRVSM